MKYSDAGVDLARADAAEKIVSRFVKGAGDFAGLFPVSFEGLTRPVLVASVDGVGTKIRVSAEHDRLETIGIDLVAMNVNDILCKGARPLFFMDYLGLPRIDIAIVEKILSGISAGCSEAGCALIGGETAELPGGEIELAGFAVGIADAANIPGAARVEEGDYVIGLPSSGLHANGLSLARAVINDEDLLLVPTKIYARELAGIMCHAIAHVTGGGIARALGRIVPEGLRCEIDWHSWERPEVFLRIAEKVKEEEMRRTFNLGIGMIVIAPEPLSFSGSILLGRVSR